MIYLDHAATTPMHGVARAAMIEAFGTWANPSSPHACGRAARAALEEARARIKAALGWRHDLIFTAGASEAIAIALARAKADGIVIRSAVEHDAVRRVVPDALVVPVAENGLIDPALLGEMLRGHPGATVAVQHVNSETGVVQPIAQIMEVVSQGGGTLLLDGAQSAGKLPLPDADLIAVAAHKFGGPPGIGALLVRDLATLHPVGGQEYGYRAGTENLPAVLGFAAAAAVEPPGDEPPGWVAQQACNRAWLDEAIAEAGGSTICGTSPRSCLIASYHMPGMSAAAQLIRFDQAGFAVSAGSACSSGSMKPSHVLAAIGLAPEVARNVVRVSFGRSTTRDQIMRFATLWGTIAQAAGGRR